MHCALISKSFKKMSFFHYIPRPADPSNSLFDTPGWQAGRVNPRANGVAQEASGHGQQAVSGLTKKVAHQFEALLIQQLLKQARQTSSEGPFDSDQTRLAQSLADEQLALQLSDPGLGLAQALLEQIREQGFNPPAAESNTLAGKNTQANPLPALKPVRAYDAHSLDELLNKLETGEPVQQSSSQLAASSDAPGHIRRFIDQMGAIALQVAQETGLPSELVLGQAALESGWGKREIIASDGRKTYNVFGIKATPAWKGQVVDVLTTEYSGGVPRKVVQKFRAYNSYSEAFSDYARLLSNNRRYEKVLSASSPTEAAFQVQKAGYATDPAYADKLISVMAYFQPKTS